MRSNLHQKDRQELYRHVTLNIITDKVSRFVSVTATHRIPSDNEIKRSDWHCILKRKNASVYVIGRGDELTKETLQALARSYVDGGSNIWIHVDLSALDAGQSPVTAIDPNDQPIDFGNDPLWQRIAAINAGRSL